MVGHKYTEAEHKFLHDFIPGHTYKEIVKAYNERFHEPITLSRIKAYIRNHKLNTGKTGRFPKGNIPFNKGKKGWRAPGSEKTWYKKGHMPHNHLPVGTIVERTDGYLQEKIGEPNKWKLKHYIVWEEAHGPVPQKYILIFKDGNKHNVNIENLELITRAENIELTRRHLRNSSPALTETGVLLARLNCRLRAKKQKIK